MTVRLKLLLPGLMTLAAVLALALWPAASVQWRSGWLIAGAVALLAWQLLLNERWVLAALRGVQDALAGRGTGGIRAREWRELVAGIASLHAARTREQYALEQAVSRAREIEWALLTTEQRYVLAVRAATDGVWEWDLGSERMLLSPRWRHMFGLDDAAETMPLDQWRVRLHADDRRETLDALDAHLRGLNSHYEHAHRLLHANGEYRWVLSRGTALRRASGTVERVVGLDIDITRLKRVECIIDAIAEGTAGCVGDAFFRALVRNFARALHVQCAFITECTDRPPSRTRTLAFWRAGGFAPDFEYELAGTPCERVIRENRIVFHRDRVGELYPFESDQASYLGLPIRGRDGAVIGHLAFVDPEPMAEDMLMEAVYRIFTARAAVEIELGQALRRLDVGDRQPGQA